MFTLTKRELADKLATFIWVYKDGDNIVFNARIIYLLLEQKSNAPSQNQILYNKPVAIIAVSMIEAIFCDLIYRLATATNHFPERLDAKRYTIKNRISFDRTRNKKTGELQIRNYSMFELLEFLKEFEILGPRSSQVYDHLQLACFLRNRIHISNYHRNFEPDEEYTFSDSRISSVLTLLSQVVNIMCNLYPRPFLSGQGNNWYNLLTQ